MGAPLIDPKPILDGWVALENTSIFRAKGENPFLATSPTIGQVLLESKQQLEPQVLHDGGIRLSRCGRQDVQTGPRRQARARGARVPVGVGAEADGGRPARAPRRAAARAANAPAGASSEALTITAVNGVPVAGHEGPGSLADSTVRKLLMLQGLARPKRIVSQLSYPGTTVAQTGPGAGNAIGVQLRGLAGLARAAASVGAELTPSEWTKLIARLGRDPRPDRRERPDLGGDTRPGCTARSAGWPPLAPRAHPRAGPAAGPRRPPRPRAARRARA